MNPIYYLFLTVCLLYNNFLFAQTDDIARAEYIDKYKLVAINEMLESSVPASVLLAQAAIQSESGRHELAIAAKNHFQALCADDWTGKIYRIETTSRQFSLVECYKRYKSVAASYADFADRLNHQKEGFHFFDTVRPDYKNWVKAVQKMNHPNKPDYVKQLMEVIKQHKLRQYDKLTLENIDNNKEMAFEEPRLDLPPTSKKEIVRINGIPSVKTKIGDSPLSIAQKYDVPLQKLLEYNDLEANKFRIMEQNIFLRPKRKKRCDGNNMHIVQRYETMYNIAQTHGIRLNILYKTNRMKRGEEPATGQAIYLCSNRETPPALSKSKTNLSVLPLAIPPPNREQTFRRPKVPKVNDGTETIDPQFIRLSVYSESSLY